MSRARLVAGLAAAALIGSVFVAARRYHDPDRPYTPSRESEVLERLGPGAGADPTAEALRVLEARLAKRPDDLTLACQVAQGHIEAARTTGDARRLAYAEAALGPFWREPAPPLPALVLRATIHQARHEFTAALADLDQVLARSKDDTQAWLMKGSILVELARYDEARASCAHAEAAPLREAACLAHVDGVTGQGKEAFARLSLALASPGVTASDAAYARFMLGEVAFYAGDLALAERELRAAIAADPSAAVARGLLCDVLLDAGRASEVLSLVPTDEPNEALVLRRAIAAKRVHAPDAAALGDRLRERDRELRDRGDLSQRRDEARRRLEVDDDPAGALEVAALGFADRKEPWDARILLEAAAQLSADPARRAEARQKAQPALSWLKQSGCTWPPLARAAQRLEGEP